MKTTMVGLLGGLVCASSLVCAEQSEPPNHPPLAGQGVFPPGPPPPGPPRTPPPIPSGDVTDETDTDSDSDQTSGEESNPETEDASG